MLHIADQTAGPIGLNVFVYTHGCSGAVKAKNIRFFFFNIFFPRATPGPSASLIYIRSKYVFNINLWMAEHCIKKRF